MPQNPIKTTDAIFHPRNTHTYGPFIDVYTLGDWRRSCWSAVDTELVIEVAGFSHDNRQELYRCIGCGRGEGIVLRAEPDNKYDKNAIQVLTDYAGLRYKRGESLGYIPSVACEAFLAAFDVSNIKGFVSSKEQINTKLTQINITLYWPGDKFIKTEKKKRRISFIDV